MLTNVDMKYSVKGKGRKEAEISEWAAPRAAAAHYLNHVATSLDYKAGFNNSITVVYLMAAWKASCGNGTTLIIIIQSWKF